MRSALRAAAHPLKPVVLIGDKGLSEAVLQEIDRNLSAHGLIKVRAGGEDRATRDELLYQICGELSCAPVHHLGKVFILYRPTERDPDAADLLGARKSKSDVSTLGTGARKANEAHLPKKLARRQRHDRPGTLPGHGQAPAAFHPRGNRFAPGRRAHHAGPPAFGPELHARRGPQDRRRQAGGQAGGQRTVAARRRP